MTIDESGNLIPTDLSAATAWRAAIDSDFNLLSEPMVRTLDENIDRTQATEGIIKVIVDANTTTFFDKINGKKQTDGYFQLRGLNGDGRIIYDFLLKVICMGSVDTTGEALEPATNTATQDWVLSIIRNAPDYEFSVDGNEWHTTQTYEDYYYRVRYNEGEWSEIIKFPVLTAGDGETIVGPQGPIGPQGPAGEAATITIGTVTTGDPGTNVIIENVGTPSAAILNFTIPRGDVGPQGPAGADGEDGKDGTDGTTVDLTNYYTKTEIDNKIGNIETRLAEI